MEEIRGNSPPRHVISFGRYIARLERGEEIGFSALSSKNVRIIEYSENSRREKMGKKLLLSSHRKFRKYVLINIYNRVKYI